MKVKWLRQALRNIEKIHEYISRDNPEAAQELVRKIQMASERLVEFPQMGRVGRVVDTRELVIPQTPYLVIYRLHGDAVEILRVLHGARRFPL
jgi:toxin ParE1/3/4